MRTSCDGLKLDHWKVSMSITLQASTTGSFLMLNFVLCFHKWQGAAAAAGPGRAAEVAPTLGPPALGTCSPPSGPREGTLVAVTSLHRQCSFQLSIKPG